MAFLVGKPLVSAKLLDGSTVRASFPPLDESRSLMRRDLIFPKVNPRFGFATAALYVLLSWAVRADIGEMGVSRFGDVLRAVGVGVLRSQVAVFWALLLVFGFLRRRRVTPNAA